MNVETLPGSGIKKVNEINYRLGKWHIYFEPPPIPCRNSDWHFYHDDYDGAPDANDNRAASLRPQPPAASSQSGIPIAIGFTGTQHGCLQKQLETLGGMLGHAFAAGIEWMENGDCIGADGQAGRLWKGLGLKISLRPCDMPKKRSFLPCDAASSPKPPLVRNRDIVDNCGILIATPGKPYEEQRSGTWATIRYARKLKRPIIIIWPDGSYSTENKPFVALRAAQGTSASGQDAQQLGAKHESAVGGGADHAPAERKRDEERKHG